jgi:TolB-like protein
MTAQRTATDRHLATAAVPRQEAANHTCDGITADIVSQFAGLRELTVIDLARLNIQPCVTLA